MNTILKQLGIYRALNASAVQFNSIVFRVVIGYLAGIPGEIVALIPAIEFTMNFLLEIPTGYLADRYGRIPFAIAGHVTVILGLSCGYIALLNLWGSDVSYLLFVLHGFFIGFTRPLTSGSIEAFYQDALERRSHDATSAAIAARSFTLSKAYGRHLTTVAVIAAFLCVYLLNRSVGAQHAFLPGILLWILTAWRLIQDYRELGDTKVYPNALLPVLKSLRIRRRATNSFFYALSSFMLLGIVMGYFIVALGREIPSSESTFKWLTIGGFMLGAQGFGWIAKSYILPFLIVRLTERNYLTFFYVLIFGSTLGVSYTLQSLPGWVNVTVILCYGLIFFTAFCAIQSVSQNMVLHNGNPADYALTLSIQNMPGLLFVGAYSLYLTLFRNGCPSTQEIFLSVSVISVMSLAIHLGLHHEPTPLPETGGSHGA